MASARKRKQRPEFNTNHSLSIRHEAEQAEQGLNLDQSLFIQAYEADIIRGPRASEAAESLEAFTYGAAADHPVQVRKIGDALIQWGGNQLGKPSAFPGDEDEFISNSSQATKSQDDEQNVVWVDRYVVSHELINLRATLAGCPSHLFGLGINSHTIVCTSSMYRSQHPFLVAFSDFKCLMFLIL